MTCPWPTADTRPALLAEEHAPRPGDRRDVPAIRPSAIRRPAIRHPAIRHPPSGHPPSGHPPSGRCDSALATISGGSIGYPVVVIFGSEPVGDTISRVVSDDLSAEAGDGIGSQHLRSMIAFASCSAIFTVDCRDAVLRAPLKSEHLKCRGRLLSLSFLAHVLQAVPATFRLGRHTAWTANPVGFCDHV